MAKNSKGRSSESPQEVLEKIKKFEFFSKPSQNQKIIHKAAADSDRKRTKHLRDLLGMLEHLRDNPELAELFHPTPTIHVVLSRNNGEGYKLLLDAYEGREDELALLTVAQAEKELRKLKSKVSYVAAVDSPDPPAIVHYPVDWLAHEMCQRLAEEEGMQEPVLIAISRDDLTPEFQAHIPPRAITLEDEWPDIN